MKTSRPVCFSYPKYPDHGPISPRGIPTQHSSPTTVSLHRQVCGTPSPSTNPVSPLPLLPPRRPVFILDTNSAMHTATGATGSNPNLRASSTPGRAQLHAIEALLADPQSDGPVQVLPQTVRLVLGAGGMMMSVTLGGAVGTGP